MPIVEYISYVFSLYMHISGEIFEERENANLVGKIYKKRKRILGERECLKLVNEIPM